MKQVYLVFDPTQMKEQGLEFIQGDHFSCRFEIHKRLFFTNIYIPFGPVFVNEEGVKEFLEFLKTFRLSKVKIDLPLVLNPETKSFIENSLKDNGFRNSQYIQDDETILIQRNDLKINSKTRRYVKIGKKAFDVVIKEKLSSAEIEAIYSIYLESAERIGFEAKSIDLFDKLAENTLSSLAINIETKKIEGYVLGYKYFIDTRGFLGKDAASILQIFSTATTEEGRRNKIGYALHYDLFEKALNEYNIDIIDFHGASRKNNRSYVEFKSTFGGEFYPHAGSFEKVNLF